MNMSKEAKIVNGITLLAIPTIMYGGVTLLGMLTQGSAGPAPGALTLDETQWALWRAGHAHAGVWVILALLIQLLIDNARLPKWAMWAARISAPVAAITVSGGFFGLAFFPEFRWLLYFGALSLFVSVIFTGIGLLRNLGPNERTSK